MWLFLTVKIYLLLIPGCALSIATRMMTSAGEEERSLSGTYVVLQWTAKLLIAFGLLGIVLTLVNPLGLMVLPLFLLCLLSLLGFIVQGGRQNFSRSMVLAIRDKMPLAIVARTLANNSSWLIRGRLDRFARGLEMGKPIGILLRETPLNIPAPIQIRLALEAEGLRSTNHGFEQILELESEYRSGVREWIEGCLYAAGLFFMLSIVSLCLFGSSGIRRISGLAIEFELDRSNSGVDWIALTGLDLNQQLLAAVAVSVICFALLNGIYLELIPRRWYWLLWGHRKFDTACNLFLIGSMMEEGNGAEAGVRSIANWHPLGIYRKQASRLLKRIEAGAPLAEALRKVGWISRRESFKIGRAADRGDLAYQMVWLANDRAHRGKAFWLWLSRIGIPILIMLIGIGVLMVTGFVYLFLSDVTSQQI